MMRARWLLIGWLFATVTAQAQDGGQDSPLTGSQGVRALGVGGAVSAWFDEPAALWWNPATLLSTPVRRLELQHTQNAFDTRTEHFALAMPSLDRGVWALGGALQTTSDITITGPLSPAPLGTEDFSRFQLGAGYGVGLPKSLDAGFTLTVSGYRFMGQQRVAWGLDFGLSPFATGVIRTGLVLKNLLRPTFSFSDGIEDRWARRLVLAVAAQTEKVSAGLDAEFSDVLDPRFRAGAEYRVVEALALRAGYDGQSPTAGLGVRYKQFRIDYAFVKPSDLGSEHRFGISIDIGRPIALQRRLREERVSQEVDAALEQRRVAKRPALEAQADSAMKSGSWGEAASAYGQLSLLFPEEPDYARGLSEVSRKSDSARGAQLSQATLQASAEERGELLDSLARSQLARRDWTAAGATASRLGQEPGYRLRSDSLKAEAQDSLAAETARALWEANARLADSAAVEAAGWAQQALYYDSGNAEASRVLAQAQLISRRQAAERAMMSAAADGDTAQALAAAQALLVQFPDHEVARQYVRRFAPMAEAVTIETIQSDTEAWTWYTHALVAFREGRFEEAIQWWEQVLARYPGSEDTRKNLEQARLRLDSGKD